MDYKLHYNFNMPYEKYKCSIYSNRPDIRKQHPTKEIDGTSKECPYILNIKGELEGECNRCGKCCFLYIDILGLKSKFHMGDPCPYFTLIKEKGGNNFVIFSNTF